MEHEQQQQLEDHGSFTVVVNGHHDEDELDQRRPLNSSTSNGNHPNVTTSQSSSNKFGSKVFSSNLWSRYFHSKTTKGHHRGSGGRWKGLNHHARLLMTPATYLDTRRKLEQAAARNLSRDNEWKIVICLILIGILAFHFTGSSDIVSGQGNSSNIIQQQQKLFSSSGGADGSNSHLAMMKNHSFSALGSTQKISHAPQRPVENIPDIYNNLVDLDTNAVSTTKRQSFGLQVPLFWHVPRSGGTTIKEIMGKCLGLVMASDINSVLSTEEKYSKQTSPYLQTMFIKHHGKYVNVDTTTLEGLKHASDLNLVASTMSQVIVSPLAYEAMQYLFDSKSWTRGLLFTILRDPIERASSLYYYREYQQNVNSTISTNNLQQSMELFFSSPQSKAENNWMTRVLLNKKMGPLYLEDLDLAKEILRRKCLIGLMTHKEASLRRFVTYFGWYNTHWNQPGVSECSEKLLFWGWANKHSFNEEVAPVDISEGTHLYKLIRKHNEFDLELYQYAKELFDQQAQMFSVTGSANSASTATAATASSTATTTHSASTVIGSQTTKQQSSPDSSTTATSIMQLPPATNIQKGELPFLPTAASSEQKKQPPPTTIAATSTTAAATDNNNNQQSQEEEGTNTNSDQSSSTGNEGGMRRL